MNPGKQAAEIDRLQHLRDLRESRDRIVEKVRAASPRLAALQYTASLDLTAIQQALDPRTVLLSYQVGKERSRLFVVPTGLRPPIAPGRLRHRGRRSQPARDEIAALRRLIERQRDAPDAAFVAAARRLFDLLVAPAQDAIDGAERILLVPDGPLHSLPFAALVRTTAAQGDRPWQYEFVEWKPLHTALSATVFAEFQKARPSSPPPQTLVAFGDPQYPATETQVVSATRAVLDRAQSLAPLPGYSGRSRLAGARVREDRDDLSRCRCY